VKQQSNLIQNLYSNTISCHLYVTDTILFNKGLVVFSGVGTTASFHHKRRLGKHKTKLTPPLLIEVYIPSQESERSCIEVSMPSQESERSCIDTEVVMCIIFPFKESRWPQPLSNY
jgi:hypothetical protein